jgi:LEA14-like dessication related protein
MLRNHVLSHTRPAGRSLALLQSMKQTSIVTTLIICLATGLAAGCSSLGIDIENPEYTIRDVRPRVSVAIPFSASTVDIDFLVEVRNPNAVGVNLDQIDFNLLINNQRIISGISNQDVRIPANGIGDVQLRTRFGYDNLRSLFREVVDVVQGERARYEIQGTAYYKTPIGRLSFPLTVYRAGR